MRHGEDRFTISHRALDSTYSPRLRPALGRVVPPRVRSRAVRARGVAFDSSVLSILACACAVGRWSGPSDEALEFRSFDLPSTPLRTVMIDTADLGAVGGLADSKQRFIISMIDPASRWAHSEIFGTKAPRAQDARQVIRDGLLELRAGPLAYEATNKENVFDANGHLTKALTVMSDRGGEFKSTTDETWEGCAVGS